MENTQGEGSGEGQQIDSSKLSSVNATPSHSRIRLTDVSPIGKRSGLLIARTKIERSLSDQSSINLEQDEEINTKSTIALSKDVQGIGNLTPSQELENELKDDEQRYERGFPIMTVYSGASSPSTERSRSPVKVKLKGKGKQGVLLIESDVEDQGELQKSISSLQKPNEGVDFLTKRLRSAIGQEILIQNNLGNGNESSLAIKSGHLERTTNKTAEVSESERSSSNTVSVDSAQAKNNLGKGWGWSTLTNLPATLRIDQALQSLSLQTTTTEDASSRSPSSVKQTTKNDQRQSSKNENRTVKSASEAITAGLMTAVDPRNWFNMGDKEEEGSPKGSLSSDTRSTRQSQLKSIPTGSFPSSGSAASRKSKEREMVRIKAQEMEQAAAAAAAAAAAERERKQAGSKVEEHNLQDHHFGVSDEQLSKYNGERFPEHEYMIMSTAGKPIFWSKISKARLSRARQNRQRKRDQQATLEKKRASGEDVTKEAEEIRIREETLAKEEQSIQDEEDQLEATSVGVLQAIISNYAETDKTKLHETSAEVLELPELGRTAFLLRPPLYLVAISHWDEAETTLRNHLEYLYQAIISLVSAVKLNALFDRAANFDLKRLLQGTDNILDSLLTRLQSETIAMRGALQPLRLNAAIRHDVGTSLIPTRNKESRPQDALYALLLTRNGIITLARRRKHSIHPIDCHLLVNTVLSTNALKEGGTQSWVPICLPKFAPQGFMYAHVSFLDDGTKDASTSPSFNQRSDRQPDLGLVLVTGNPDGFEEMSMWRERITKQLKESEMLEKLLQTARPTVSKEEEESETKTAVTADSTRFSADELGIPGLRHFCFKWRSNVQSTSPTFEEPYLPGTDDHHRLLYLYGLAHEKVVKSSKENSLRSKKGKQDDSSNVSPAMSDTESILNSSRGKRNREGEGGETDDASSTHTTNTIERRNNKSSLTIPDCSNRMDRDRQSPSRGSVRSSSPPIIPRSVLQTKRQNSSSSTSATNTAANLLKQTIGGIGFEQSRSTTFTHLIRTKNESVLAWSTPPFELYVCASPHIPKNALIAMAKSVVKWIKQEEHQLFIVSAPIF